MTLSAFPEKFLNYKYIFEFSMRRLTQRLNRLTNLVQILYLGFSCKYLHYFIFGPILEIKGSSYKKQANELSDKHGILQT